MIIDFKVTNFRSIKGSATLSFLSQKPRRSVKDGVDSESPDDKITKGFQFPGQNSNVLPVCAVFGANASGKSNVLLALNRFLFYMYRGTESKENLARDFAPFRLNRMSVHEPTRFEINIVCDTKLYAFQVEMLGGLVLFEKLLLTELSAKRQVARLLYSRIWKPAEQTYVTESGSAFKGPHVQLLNTIETHEIFFTLLKKLDVKVTKPLTAWLSPWMPGMFQGYDQFDTNFAAGSAHLFQDYRNLSIKILKAFDTGLNDVEIEVNEEELETDFQYRLWAIHQMQGEQIKWNFKEESFGTQRLFAVAHRMIFALWFGTPLIIDEFGSNFHPEISRSIIALFQDTTINVNNAQLIFTSHDNTLWKGRILRRDEIWLTEKQKDNSTELVALTDYSVRNDIALDKAYLDGRFGGVPVIGDFSSFIKIPPRSILGEE